MAPDVLRGKAMSIFLEVGGRAALPPPGLLVLLGPCDFLSRKRNEVLNRTGVSHDNVVCRHGLTD